MNKILRSSASWLIIGSALLLMATGCSRDHAQPDRKGIDMSAPDAQSAAVVYPAPEGEPLSKDFTLTVNGRAVPVYSCRVSAMPFNQVWPGYQRPLDQTELASFAYWDMSGPVQVEVVSSAPVQSVAVRPSARAIRPTVEGNRIAFTLPAPGPLTVEVNGWHHALHLFAGPPASPPPDPHDPNVLYFGPGVHKPGKVLLHDNQTVYLAPGSVVYGAFDATSVSNVRIFGRGIIDASNFARDEGGGCIRVTDSRNVIVDGLTLRDPDVWCLTVLGSDKVDLSNLRLVGLWRYNSDGIDVCNSRDVTIRDSFIRSFDDSIVVKGIINRRDLPVRNVLVERCVIWNDWGRALEIGAETCAPEITNLVFRDCDIIRTVNVAMDVQHGDRALVADLLFENIRVEVDDLNFPPALQQRPGEKYLEQPGGYSPALLVVEIVGTMWSKDTQRGTARNITFRNIDVTGKPVMSSELQGFDAQHVVRNVTIENLRVNGRIMRTPQEASISVGSFVEGVRVLAP